MRSEEALQGTHSSARARPGSSMREHSEGKIQACSSGVWREITTGGKGKEGTGESGAVRGSWDKGKGPVTKLDDLSLVTYFPRWNERTNS